MDRDACERRVYRLALLLTGDRRAATRVIEEVVEAQSDLGKIDSARLDRLTVLRSREKAGAGTGGNRSTVVSTDVTEALGRMPTQAREAWIFERVYRLDRREAARSMDCSRTATTRHLEQAEAALQQVLGSGAEADAAAERVLQYSLSVDVPGFYRAKQRRRRRWRRVRWLFLAMLLAACVVAAVTWWRDVSDRAAGDSVPVSPPPSAASEGGDADG